MAKIAHTGFVINDGAGVNDHALTHPCGRPKVCRMRNQGTHTDAGCGEISVANRSAGNAPSPVRDHLDPLRIDLNDLSTHLPLTQMGDGANCHSSSQAFPSGMRDR